MSKKYTSDLFVKNGGTDSEFLMADGSVSSGGDLTLVNTITVSTRDFILSDKNKNLQNSGQVVLTLRDNDTTGFPVGTQIYLTKADASDFSIFGSGVTINSVDGALNLREQWSGAVLLQTDIDVWNFNGDITN